MITRHLNISCVVNPNIFSLLSKKSKVTRKYSHLRGWVGKTEWGHHRKQLPAAAKNGVCNELKETKILNKAERKLEVILSYNTQSTDPLLKTQYLQNIFFTFICRNKQNIDQSHPFSCLFMNIWQALSQGLQSLIDLKRAVNKHNNGPITIAEKCGGRLERSEILPPGLSAVRH